MISNVSSTLHTTAAAPSYQVKVSASEKNAQPEVAQTRGVETYDFSNMKAADILPTINKLITSGQMSLDESGSIIGLMAPYNGDVNDLGEKRFDLFSALQKSQAYNRQTMNHTAAAYDEKALAALTRLQGAVSKVNISA